VVGRGASRVAGELCMGAHGGAVFGPRG